MVVSTFPTFEIAVDGLYERNREGIELVRSRLGKADKQDIEGYCPAFPEDTKYFFLLELGGILLSGQSKHFEIEDDVKELLLRTKAPKHPEIRLPFEFIYLDVKMTKEELLRMGIHLDADSINGIMIRKGDILYYGNEPVPEVVGKDLRVSVCAIRQTSEGDYHSITTFASKLEIFKDRGKVKLDTPTMISLNDQKVVADFVVNFLYFVNNPDVKYVYHERGEKNRLKRRKAGKPILPSSYSITITGETLRYLNEVKAGIRSECRYAFDVRGHYRVLNSPFYKEKRGVRIWVSHFVKGKDKGFMVEKYYDVKEDKTK